ncbi:MAG: O-antigen ligase family protein, partial [Cytophagales bacterium]|nr:O-antigen ligase family protein [Cytophaga sp.]
MTLLSEQVLHKKEAAGRSINNAIFLFYILLFVEGILRKWVLPSLSSPLFFIKDPVLLYMYWVCWKNKLFPKTVLFQSSVILALLYLLLSLTQMIIYTTPFVASVYGWRNYFMYMPLAFIIQKHMTKKDLIRIAKFTCYIGIAIAILTYIQFLNSPDAYINNNAGENSGASFTVIGDIVRPYGPFSFVSGMAFFTPSLLVMLLFNYFLPVKDRFLSGWMYVICFFAFASNLAVSGSRGTYGNVVILVVSLICGLLLFAHKQKGIKSLFVIISIGSLALIIYSIVFSTQIDIINERFEVASEAEGSLASRYATSFIRSEEISANLPVWGVGIGAGSAGANYLATGVADFSISESDW